MADSKKSLAVILEDGETWTLITGCKIVEIDDEEWMNSDHSDIYEYKHLRTWKLMRTAFNEPVLVEEK